MAQVLLDGEEANEANGFGHLVVRVVTPAAGVGDRTLRPGRTKDGESYISREIGCQLGIPVEKQDQLWEGWKGF